MKVKSNLEQYFEWCLKIHKKLIPEFKREFRFHKKRRWRFDFAWPMVMVAVEIDGGTNLPRGGRHNTDKDREKINTAVSMGWRVLRFSGSQVKNSPKQCIDVLVETINYSK